MASHKDGIDRENERHLEPVPGTPDLPTAGGDIISGHGDLVPDQTEGGLVVSGHGDEVGDETAGGDIIEGRGDEVPDPANERTVENRGRHARD